MPGTCTDNSAMMPGFYVKKKKVSWTLFDIESIAVDLFNFSCFIPSSLK